MNYYFNIHSGQTGINTVSDGNGMYFNVNYSTTPTPPVGTGKFIVSRSGTTSNNYMYSSDGITWFSGRTTYPLNVKDIDSKNSGNYVAVGSGGFLDYQVAAYSDISVLPPKNLVNTKSWESISYSPELNLYAAVAFSEAITTTGATNAVTTVDGTTWNYRTTPTRTQGSLTYTKPWNHVKWYSGCSLFVATSYHAFDLVNNIMTSPNGIVWTLRNTPSDFVYGYDSCYSPSLGIYLISGGGGGNNPYAGKIMGSTNGTSWSRYFQNTGSVSDRNDFVGIDWSEKLGMFLVLYSSKALYATSTNGTVWTVRSLPQIGSYVAWSDKNECFVVTSGDDILISYDGLNWTTQTPFPGVTNNKIKWVKD